jgi:formamidopyrimidine-DNA glycosylase
MPELPEVEVVRRGLVAKITNRKIIDVIVRREGLRWPFPSDLREKLLHQRVSDIQRRGKYLLMTSGNAGHLLVHLGMTGSFVWYDAPPVHSAHDHLDIVFEQGVLRYNDPRRFGAVLWMVSFEPRAKGVDQAIFIGWSCSRRGWQYLLFRDTFSRRS